MLSGSYNHILHKYGSFGQQKTSLVIQSNLTNDEKKVNEIYRFAHFLEANVKTLMLCKIY